jgi:hypothetical protein
MIETHMGGGSRGDSWTWDRQWGRMGGNWGPSDSKTPTGERSTSC